MYLVLKTTQNDQNLHIFDFWTQLRSMVIFPLVLRCSRWLPVVWFTWLWLKLIKLIAGTQSKICLSCLISCSTTPGDRPADNVWMTYVIRSQISNQISLSCHPHIIHTSSACHPRWDFSPKIFPVKQQSNSSAKNQRINGKQRTFSPLRLLLLGLNTVQGVERTFKDKLTRIGPVLKIFKRKLQLFERFSIHLTSLERMMVLIDKLTCGRND